MRVDNGYWKLTEYRPARNPAAGMNTRMKPLIVQVEQVGAHSAQTIAFDYSPVRIGRNPLNDINLGDGFVSQWHAVVRFDAEQTVYVDLGSRNGSTLNGRRLHKNEEVFVNESTDLRIGPLRLHLLRGDVPPELLNVGRASAFILGGAAAAPAIESTAYMDQDASKHLVGLRNARAGGPQHAASIRPPAMVQPPAMVKPPEVAQAAPHAGSVPATAMHGTALPPSSPPPAPAQHAGPVGGTTPATDQLYRTYRQSWEQLQRQLVNDVERHPPAERGTIARRLADRFPLISNEPDGRALLKQHGATSDASTHSDPDFKDWLGRLTNGLCPPPMVKLNTTVTMERVGALLEVFGQAFVELRRSQQEFCNEMALDQVADDTTLYRTDDPRVALAYLLDPTSAGAARINELSRAFADFALHQVALVSGVTDGARALLEQMAPEALAGEQAPAKRADGEDGFLSKWLGGANAKLWNRYLTQYENLMEGDRFTRELFGRHFARAYYRMTGGRISHVPPP